MAKPNHKFELNVNDLDIIEQSLRQYAHNKDTSIKYKINELLGKLHNQKNWFRPKNKTYISG